MKNENSFFMRPLFYKEIQTMQSNERIVPLLYLRLGSQMKGVFFCPNLNSPLDNMEGIFRFFSCF